jgi:heat-inducible transcriptional repressor
MLDERKASILRAVVEEYIATAQPVGSAHVAAAPRIGVSPATVRNEMAYLEHEGYLVQPHTSAGRIPTDKGYRAFVDQLTGPGQLDTGRRQLVKDFFAKAHGELEDMLKDTSRLLSSVTDYAGVVVGPPHEAATIRSIQVVGLAHGVALAVAVLSNGTVEKRTLDIADDVGDERMAAATAHLSAHLAGRTLRDPAVSIPSTGDAATDALSERAVRAFSQDDGDEGDHIYVGGTARIASAFDAVDTVREVLGVLEQQYVIVGLLRDLLDRGLTVSIGSEHGVQNLAECSIVIAPYEVEGEQAGTIAVLGPTRMNYPQALAAVAVVGSRLGQRLSEG